MTSTIISWKDCCETKFAVKEYSIDYQIKICQFTSVLKHSITAKLKFGQSFCFEIPTIFSANGKAVYYLCIIDVMYCVHNKPPPYIMFVRQ